MDPITLAIISSLAAGITAGGAKISEKALVDVYDALKNLLTQKFGKESEVVKAVEDLEANPKSEGRKKILQEEVTTSKADEDPEILRTAEKLLAQLKEIPEGQTIVTQFVSGDRNVFSGSGDVTVTSNSDT